MFSRIISQLEADMKKRIDAFKFELTKLRIGRAHPSILENVTVEYYDKLVPISQVASINVSDPRTLTIAPWEKTMLKPIEKAIFNSGLGLNPMNDGDKIRIPMPPLTEERRKELVKVLKNATEEARIGIRDLRHQAKDEIKTLQKKKEITEDDERRAEDQIQKVTDKSISEVDQVALSKEKELLTV
jgi:ribosome recycling factor